MRTKPMRSFGAASRRGAASSSTSLSGFRRSLRWLVPSLAVLCLLYGLVLLQMYRDGFDVRTRTGAQAGAGVVFRNGVDTRRGGAHERRQPQSVKTESTTHTTETTESTKVLPTMAPKPQRTHSLTEEFVTRTPSPSPTIHLGGTPATTAAKGPVIVTATRLKTEKTKATPSNSQRISRPTSVKMESEAPQQNSPGPVVPSKTAAAKGLVAPVVTAKTSPVDARLDPDTPTLRPSSTQESDLHAPMPGNQLAKDNTATPAQRIDTVAGYEATLEYLENYPSKLDNLYLFFVCSDEKFQPLHWSPLCEEAETKVRAAFANSPSTNQLLVIRAGSEKYWSEKNSFRSDPNLRLKTVPAVMKWHGNGRTSGMLNAISVTDEQFLEYLFGNEQLVKRVTSRQKSLRLEIDTVTSIDAYNDIMNKYDKSYQLYVVFISGRLERNDRLWCPYCRYSHLPLELGFFLHARPQARLVRIEVADTYAKWKKRTPFHDLPKLNLRSVPSFYTVRINGDKELEFDRFEGRLDNMPALRGLFAPKG